jgi:hypothetical protein
MSTTAATIFLLVGLGIGAVMVLNLIRGRRSRHWPIVPGVVLDSQVNSYTDDEGTRMYGVAITYRYEVDGYEFSGNRRTFGEFNSNNRGRAERIVAQYLPGSDVQVYYDPDDPTKAVLEPGTNSTSILFLLLPLIFIGLGLAGFLGLL